MDGSMHWFWALTVLACLAWYSTITVYVAIRGFADIRGMLARLNEAARDDSSG